MQLLLHQQIPCPSFHLLKLRVNFFFFLLQRLDQDKPMDLLWREEKKVNLRLQVSHNQKWEVCFLLEEFLVRVCEKKKTCSIYMNQFMNELLTFTQYLNLSIDSQTTGTQGNGPMATPLRNLLQHLMLCRCRHSLPSSQLPQLLLLLFYLVAYCRIEVQVIFTSFEAAVHPGLKHQMGGSGCQS